MNDQGTVLVTGGAGYIGSHVVWALSDAGRRVVVLDDLSTGNRDAISGDVTLVIGDAGDRGRVEALIGEYGCTAVMHFAGSIVVGESVEKPLDYYAKLPARHEAVTVAEVQSAAKKYLVPQKMQILLVGDTKPHSEALNGLGLGALEEIPVPGR